MILSFHPCFNGEKNIICAGRRPNIDDIQAIKKATAVILPQGCRPDLYKMARQHCRHVFPNYDARFNHPGKLGQIHLFRTTGAPHPLTMTFTSLSKYLHKWNETALVSHFPYPFVFKFNWGGEGHNVFLIQTAKDLEKCLEQAAIFERSGQKGFLIQKYVDGLQRSLRVVIIGEAMYSYWRVQPGSAPLLDLSIASGAHIDYFSDEAIQAEAISLTRTFCDQACINLAGLDLVAASNPSDPKLSFLEINYYFGRRGLGGSSTYYKLLEKSIHCWIAQLPN
ncbi:MAG: hypothetical protein QNI95_09160 [Desulfobacterales bacterium]|nr:hypothetical protein [Desulfobacterales bacterium]